MVSKGRYSPWPRRLRALSFVTLFLSLMMALAWFGNHYRLQWDWTANGRNTLSPASRALLAELDGPLRITAFARDNPVLRRHIRGLVGRYQRAADDIELLFVDLAREPRRVREAGVSREGELRVEYDGRTERVLRLSEQSLSNALQRLLREGSRRLLFLNGHGERRPRGAAAYDLGHWTAQLESKGFHVETINPAVTPLPSAGAGVLVLASPRTALLPGELQALQKFLVAGGRLLWLQDPGAGEGLAPLAKTLGLRFQPGVVIDPTVSRVGARLFGTDDPRVALVAAYGDHPVVQGFDLNTLFPVAGSLAINEDSGWQATAFLRTLSSAWAESGATLGQVGFDPLSDIAGPLTLGVALSRSPPGGKPEEQRVLVVADGDFLSNGFLGASGNLQLALNMVNWLSGDPRLLAIPVGSAPDATLTLSRPAIVTISLGFLLVLPALILGSGFFIWWRRRRR